MGKVIQLKPKEKPPKTWRCPECGRLIAEIELLHVRDNFGCPGVGLEKCSMRLGNYVCQYAYKKNPWQRKA